uniref:Uncharacterized protein n=1 Tax=Denticeps clupeoides TaxID=299321 RepID=A0AAY4D4A3_9TELE
MDKRKIEQKNRGQVKATNKGKELKELYKRICRNCWFQLLSVPVFEAMERADGSNRDKRLHSVLGSFNSHKAFIWKNL